MISIVDAFRYRISYLNNLQLLSYYLFTAFRAPISWIYVWSLTHLSQCINQILNHKGLITTQNFIILTVLWTKTLFICLLDCLFVTEVMAYSYYYRVTDGEHVLLVKITATASCVPVLCITSGSLKGNSTQKWTFCYHICTLMLSQMYMTSGKSFYVLFLLHNRNSNTTHIYRGSQWFQLLSITFIIA